MKTSLEELLKHPFTITIGRQYGSGGRAIGRILANELGIEYIDREIINHASIESGLAPEYFERADEVAPRGLLGAIRANLSMGSGSTDSQCTLSRESIFMFQADVIRQIAETKSCIIVGRCADYILRNNPRTISLFICAPIQDRIARTVQHESLTIRAAEDQCRKNDRRRENYYNFYTDRTWGAVDSYHLTIDSSILGIENSAKLLKEYVLTRLEASML